MCLNVYIITKGQYWKQTRLCKHVICYFFMFLFQMIYWHINVWMHLKDPIYLWPHHVKTCNDVNSSHCMPMCDNQLPWRGIINSCQKKTFQYMMVNWRSQVHTLLCEKYKLIAFFMNKNASCLIGGVCHCKCCCTCLKNSSLSRNQKQNFQNSLNKFKDIWK